MTDDAFERFIIDLRESFPSKPWAAPEARYWLDLKRNLDAARFDPDELSRAFGRLMVMDWFPDSLVLTLRTAIEAIRADDRANGFQPHAAIGDDEPQIQANWRALSPAQQVEWFEWFDERRPQWLNRIKAGRGEARFSRLVRDGMVQVLAFEASRGSDLEEHLGPPESTPAGNLFGNAAPGEAQAPLGHVA